jgi:hypothetical protein
MAYEDQIYHRQRAEQCRTMAELASDLEVRRRHRQLARLHAGRAIDANATAEVAVG